MKPRVATAWLGGCSGCHMSFLDLDERLLELAPKIELVYSPLADVKEFPHDVDVTLVEGAVTNDENVHLAKTIRQRSRFVVSFGDCATAGNVTAMRNKVTPEGLLHRAYGAVPFETPPLVRLLPKARPLHETIPVDAFLHGCPPSPDEIWFALSALLEGRIPALPPAYQRYG